MVQCLIALLRRKLRNIFGRADQSAWKWRRTAFAILKGFMKLLMSIAKPKSGECREKMFVVSPRALRAAVFFSFVVAETLGPILPFKMSYRDVAIVDTFFYYESYGRYGRHHAFSCVYTYRYARVLGVFCVRVLTFIITRAFHRFSR